MPTRAPSAPAGAECSCRRSATACRDAAVSSAPSGQLGARSAPAACGSSSSPPVYSIPVILGDPYRPYTDASSTVRPVSGASSSRIRAVERRAARGWPNTRHARRSLTSGSTRWTFSTAAGQHAGLRSFPWRPPAGSPFPIPRQRAAASALCCPARTPSGASPGPPSSRRTTSATGLLSRP
jgi:hypothetical protein